MTQTCSYEFRFSCSYLHIKFYTVEVQTKSIIPVEPIITTIFLVVSAILAIVIGMVGCRWVVQLIIQTQCRLESNGEWLVPALEPFGSIPHSHIGDHEYDPACHVFCPRPLIFAQRWPQLFEPGARYLWKGRNYFWIPLTAHLNKRAGLHEQIVPALSQYRYFLVRLMLCYWRL